MMNQQTKVISEADEQVLNLVKALIESNVKKHYTIQELAQKTGFNRTKLCYGFKQLFGCSIHQFAIQQRILLAKELLSGNEYQVKVVAQQCGYKTLQHFVTAFKKSTGITPSTFQKSNH